MTGPAPTRDVLVWLTTWRRPDLLAQTLASLPPALQGLTADVHITVNETDAETERVIAAADFTGLPGLLLPVAYCRKNWGLNRPLQRLAPRLVDDYRYLLLSEDDVLRHEPVATYVQLADAHPWIGAVTGHAFDSHPRVAPYTFAGRTWQMVCLSGAVDLLLPVATYRRLRPFPIHKLTDLDWHIQRDAPNSLQSRHQLTAWLPGAAEHIGDGRSTWIGRS